jgi:hypothetical protein
VVSAENMHALVGKSKSHLLAKFNPTQVIDRESKKYTIAITIYFFNKKIEF